MIRDRSLSARFWRGLIYAFVGLFALLCLAPMIHILAVSFSDRAASDGHLVTFWPVRFTTASYEKVFESGAFYRSFGISVARLVLGTSLNMILTILVAYPLSKTAQQLRGRRYIIGFVLFAMLFSGGLIPLFLVVRNLDMLNTLWALVLPSALPIWNVILLMNFFRDMPKELEEAALVDGASHWRLLWSIYLPLSLPALATLTLFSAVGHWNAWFDGMIYMQQENQPLQTFLRTVVINLDTSMLIRDPARMAEFSDRSVRAAQIFVTTLPILLLYPFLQRYFIHGLRLGSVKG